MAHHSLTLYRRHTSTCAHRFKKDHRVHERDRKQCGCPIQAQGILGSGIKVRNASTGTNSFSEAHQIANLWEEWGSSEPPADVLRQRVRDAEASKATTVQDAVESFLTKKRNERKDADLTQSQQLLTLRLLPWCEAKGFKWIQELDSKGTIAEFRHSWKNENPTKNRKLAEGEAIPSIPLGASTSGRLLTSLREFLDHCVAHNWHSKNWAAKEHLKVVVKGEPKEPFTLEEEHALYEACQFITDGKGFKAKRTGQQNAKENLAMLKLMRHTGLRISDAVTIRRSELIVYEGRRALQKITKKNNKLVTVPVPSELTAMLDALPNKREDYLFLGGDGFGKLTTAITNWEGRISSVVAIAKERNPKLFTVPKSPNHGWRLPFSTRLLEKGMSVRNVA